jgi:hypothetical protein
MDIGRAEYFAVTDAEALEAFQHVSKLEGIIPALETSHAFAYLKVGRGSERGLRTPSSVWLVKFRCSFCFQLPNKPCRASSFDDSMLTAQCIVLPDIAAVV